MSLLCYRIREEAVEQHAHLYLHATIGSPAPATVMARNVCGGGGGSTPKNPISFRTGVPDGWQTWGWREDTGQVIYTVEAIASHYELVKGKKARGGQACEPSPQEAEIGGAEVQGSLDLYSEFETSLGYMRPCLARRKWRGSQCPMVLVFLGDPGLPGYPHSPPGYHRLAYHMCALGLFTVPARSLGLKSFGQMTCPDPRPGKS